MHGHQSWPVRQEESVAFLVPGSTLFFSNMMKDKWKAGKHPIRTPLHPTSYAVTL